MHARRSQLLSFSGASLGVLLAVLSSSGAAQTASFIVTGVTTQIVGRDPWGKEWATLAFQIKNASTQTLTLVDTGDCAPFENSGDYDEDVGNWVGPYTCDPGVTSPSGVAVAPGATQLVSMTIYHSATVGMPTLRVWPASNPAAALVIGASVHWSIYPEVLTATLVESTFTPTGNQNTGSVGANVSAHLNLYMRNAGNTSATYALGPVMCPGMVSCTLDAATVTVSANSSALFGVQIRTGGAGATQTVSVPITAPPRASGLIETATSSYTETVIDMVPPNMTPSLGDWVADGGVPIPA